MNYKIGNYNNNFLNQEKLTKKEWENIEIITNNINEQEILTYIMTDSVSALNNLVTKGNLSVNTVINRDYRFKGLSLLEIAVLNEKIEIYLNQKTINWKENPMESLL